MINIIIFSQKVRWLYRLSLTSCRLFNTDLKVISANFGYFANTDTLAHVSRLKFNA